VLGAGHEYLSRRARRQPESSPARVLDRHPGPRCSPFASRPDTTDLPDTTRQPLAWSTDDRFLFYTRPDDAWRAYQIWRHEVGTDANDDVLVYQEDDTHFDVGLYSTRSDRFIVIAAESRTTSEVRLLDATDALAASRVVEPRSPGI
jgi:oligopeptidase B